MLSTPSASKIFNGPDNRLLANLGSLWPIVVLANWLIGLQLLSINEPLAVLIVSHFVFITRSIFMATKSIFIAKLMLYLIAGKSTGGPCQMKPVIPITVNDQQ